MLRIIDEFSRKNLTVRIARKLKATDVIEPLGHRPSAPAAPYGPPQGDSQNAIFKLTF
jgi:hypothetical protein